MTILSYSKQEVDDFLGELYHLFHTIWHEATDEEAERLAKKGENIIDKKKFKVINERTRIREELDKIDSIVARLQHGDESYCFNCKKFFSDEDYNLHKTHTILHFCDEDWYGATRVLKIIINEVFK